MSSPATPPARPVPGASVYVDVASGQTHLLPEGMVEIEPGLFQGPLRSGPRYGLVRIHYTPGGLVTRLLTWTNLCRLPSEPADLWGIDISYNSVRRLISAGFIQAVEPTPGTFLVDLDSLFEHIQHTRVRGWWTDERRRLWAETREDEHARPMPGKRRKRLK